jgi:MFS family permease
VLALGQGIAHPSLSALTSKLAGPDEIGGVMGVYQSISSLARIAGPFWAELSSLARIAGPFWAELVYGGLGYPWPFRTGSVFMLMACMTAAVMLSRLRRREGRTA